MDVYEQLMNAADDMLKTIHADGKQVLVVKTEQGKILSFVNDLSSAEEEQFLSIQKEPIVALLCVWANRQIDLPSIRIRKGLVEIDSRNADAVIYVQGEEISTRLLSQTI